jgi:hypothetical protein
MNNEVIAIVINIIMVCIVVYQSRQQYKQFNQQMKEQSEIEVFKILTIKGNKISDFYEVIYNKVTKNISTMTKRTYLKCIQCVVNSLNLY